VIRGNHRLTVREVADEMGNSIGSYHQIFTEKLQMPSRLWKIRTAFVDYRKENRVEISKELLVSANSNENVLNIITGDET